ncbi:Laminin subunit gamma-1 [Collichthys lucidus]|uniref:Laminin subunit gamma-1 n=1 Tax=Collichthys lucidus TaxID=240159 RepID=A0A4U5UVK7_COLLU|nr:Laminin subunit gamma-1 [Collichthys lucidus]
MKSGWILLCGLLAAVCTVQSTYTYYSILRCDCNGRSRYCLRDASGSVSSGCDSRGRCSCKDGVTGEKCDRCGDGPIGPNGCTQSRQPREDSGSLSLPCFCYGHSSQCSPRSGYSVHAITSNFATGPDGWKTATAQGVTPDDVHFHWSPKHQDVEVISKSSLPVYLYAPAPYLRNQLLSYGQNFSFSLRLDRGVRHPSTNDVILEGAGLRVSASLGDLRSIVPCGQKISYSFRPGFEGLRCQRSNCPTCFGPIKAKIGQTVVNSVFQMEAYAAKLKELETLFSDMDAGFQPANREMEASLRAAQDAVEDMQSSIKRLADLEKDLQSRLSSISRSQLADGQDIQFIAEAAVDIKQRQQTYKTKVDEVQTLIEEMRRKLVKAQTHLRSAEVPLGDAPLDSNSLSHLVKEATGLADEHQTDANAVERSATDALMDSEKSLALVRMLMNRENKVKELIGDLRTMSMLERPEHGVSSNDVYVFRYDQTSNQVRSLEDQASRLSGEARDESKMADGMLKDITRMERSIPPSLKDGVDVMVSRLGGLREEVDGDISGFEALQDGVQRDMAAARDLLTKGTAAQQKFNKLVDRVNVAKADTEDALQRIKSNTNELDDALNTLKGFDQQIDGNKALADDAIKRLPGINATIQQAVSSNAETLSVLGDLSDGYHSALGTINVLENVVNNLEETFGTLPSQTGQAIEASNKLNQDVKNLKTKAVGVAGELNFELDAARRLEADADQAAVDAAEALNNAKQTQAAVGKTLQDINSLLADLKKPGVVDENLLKKLEDSLAGAQSDVEGRLRPRLRDMEEQEAAQRRRLTGINQDIDTIMRDIANLEDILNAVPSGCYNSPPIEEP